MPHIFRFSKQIRYCGCCPCVWLVHITTATTCSKSTHCKIIRRSFHLVIIENPCYLHRSFSLKNKIEISSDYICCFLINNPVIGIFRILFISVYCSACKMFPIHTFCMHYRFDFPACVPYIPFIHNVKKRGKLITVAPGIINAV